MLTYTAQVVAPFVTPALAWAGVAMVTIPVAIHLLSRWRRRPEPWGAMRFLLAAYRKQKRRMRLEQWVLLMLRCLIVFVLGLALARPLLVGLLGSLFGGLDNRGRVVNIVVDDSLSLRAEDGVGTTRFDRVIESAQAVIDALEPGDRVTIWRAGRPGAAVTAGPSQDHAALGQALTGMRPGYGRPDVPGVLRLIEESADDRSEAQTPTITYLFSDFARSAQYIEQAPETRLGARVGSHTVVVSRPMLPTNNVQVTSVRPRRRVVWVGGPADPSLAIEATVARFSDDLAEATVGLNVELLGADGRSLASARRRAVFVNGQSETTLGIDLPIGASPSWLAAQGGTLLTVRAQLDSGTDVLTADNQAHAVIELRRRMRVAVVDEPGAVLEGQDRGPTPGQWVTLALNPRLTGSGGTIEVLNVAPAELNDPDTLLTLDAVMLMRPDRVVRPVWRSLHAFVQDGGLLWVFSPPEEGSSPWVSLMVEVFEPGWRVGMEAVRPETAAAPSLDGRSDPAEPLGRLAADLEALIRPLRVYRYLPLRVTGSDAWISLSDPTPAESAGPADSDHVLLAHGRIGLGSLLVLSTAVDTRWTNLPTKPLFVPLLHETLHGVLGSRDRPGVVQAVAGDTPALGPAWTGVTGLDRLTTGDDLIAADADVLTRAGPALQIGGSGVALAAPLTLPGVYQAATDGGPRRLVVDPDARAGDTRQVSADTLAGWLDGTGDWQWLDADDPGAALRRSSDSADIGWALLWLVLALVLFEAAAARLLSHAAAGRSQSLSHQIWRTAMRLRSGDRAEERRGRAA